MGKNPWKSHGLLLMEISWNFSVRVVHIHIVYYCSVIHIYEICVLYNIELKSYCGMLNHHTELQDQEQDSEVQDQDRYSRVPSLYFVYVPIPPTLRDDHRS